MQDASPMAFLNFAREYHEAAELLFALNRSRGTPVTGHRPLTNVIYFLYFHSMELALKAFLRSHDVSIDPHRKHHELTRLYEECLHWGLEIGPDDRAKIGSIVNLLEAGNEYQDFRYFSLNSSTRPDLVWTRDVVEQLMRGVERCIEADSKRNEASGKPVKLIIELGEPKPED
jgi:HEPN domain